MNSVPVYTSPKSVSRQKKWQLFKLMLALFGIGLAAFSLTLPWTGQVWRAIDTLFFNIANGSLRDHPTWQLFWAIANHKIADWIEDIAFLGFWVAYIRTIPRGQRLRGLAELLFSILLIGATIFFINKSLFRESLVIPRASPTLVIDSAVWLSKEIPWMEIKDFSPTSFPGDHGTTAILFAATLSRYANRRISIYAWIYSIFLCLPRLMTGAHWLSDLAVGGAGIALLSLSIAYYTPLEKSLIDLFEKALLLFAKAKKKKEKEEEKE
jgi:membrane-associated phospholipid phosphatase